MNDGRDDLPRDAHLRQALRHAPDHDAAAPPSLSASILAQARTAVQPAPPRREPAPPWWSRLWQQLATPAFGGAFASVMLVGVIGVMWQNGPPPEALPGAERDLAKAPAAVPAAAPPAPVAAVQDRARADEPQQALHLPTMPARKAAPAAPAAPPAVARAPAPKAAETPPAAPAAPPTTENSSSPALSGEGEARKQRAAAGPVANTAPSPAAAPSPVPAAPPALAQAPAAVPPARSILQEAARDAEAQPLTARREASTSGALGSTSLARPAPPLDPLGAPLAALANAAPDDTRSRDARQALLDARRQAIGPWQPVETPTAEPTLVVVAPDGAPMGRLWVDERGLTWQPTRGSALRALKASPPR